MGMGEMVLHDAQPGPLTHCQISGSSDLNLIIDLGAQPLCDSLVTTLDDPEIHYPLGLWHCPESGLAQLDFVVPGEEVYPPEYPYRSGVSVPLAEYQRAFASHVMELFPDSRPNPLVVDIGSNDGTLLTGFKRAGWRALGVEPTDVANIAQIENDIVTVQAFFTEELAKTIVKSYGHPAIVTMTNVFAHMAGLGEVMRGICTLMNRGSVFITESHYLYDVWKHFQFDTIYHEHIRTYSVKSLVYLAKLYGLEVFRVEHGDRYGGNIRAYIARAGERSVDNSVPSFLALEDNSGLHEPGTWAVWASEVKANKYRTMEFLLSARARGDLIAGCSAPGRASTLLNWYGIKKDLIPYTGEVPGSLKLGKYIPGARIPIVENTRLAKDQPDYIMLFAWHYAEFITKRLRSEGITSTLIKPLPYFELIEG